MELLNKLMPEKSEKFRNLQVAILHKLIFEKLGIKEVEYIKGNKETKEKMQGKTAFFVLPPSVEDVFEISENGELMPEKSTYFYPKIYSGLVMYQLKP